jgi:hypothetical protein
MHGYRVRPPDRIALTKTGQVAVSSTPIHLLARYEPVWHLSGMQARQLATSCLQNVLISRPSWLSRKRHEPQPLRRSKQDRISFGRKRFVTYTGWYPCYFPARHDGGRSRCRPALGFWGIVLGIALVLSIVDEAVTKRRKRLSRQMSLDRSGRMAGQVTWPCMSRASVIESLCRPRLCHAATPNPESLAAVSGALCCAVRWQFRIAFCTARAAERNYRGLCDTVLTAGLAWVHIGPGQCVQFWPWCP